MYTQSDTNEADNTRLFCSCKHKLTFVAAPKIEDGLQMPSRLRSRISTLPKPTTSKWYYPTTFVDGLFARL